MVLVMENVSDDGILPGDDDDEEEDGELVATPRKGTNDELSDISDIDLDDAVKMGTLEPSSTVLNHVSIGSNAGNPSPEDDDPDVEILYMRLKALQSMKEKLDKEEEEEEEDEMIDQMEDLLNEAELAAKEANKQHKEESSSTSNFLIGDLDEAGMDLIMRSSLSEDVGEPAEKMSSVVKRLKEAAKKTILSASSTKPEDHFYYSPTQSPLRDVVTSDIDLLDLNTTSTSPEPTLSENEEATSVVDMEIDNDEATEAEMKFFKQQREEPLFAPNDWEMNNHVAPDHAPPSNKSVNNNDDEAKLEAYHMAVLAQNKSPPSTLAPNFRRKRTRGNSCVIEDNPNQIAMSIVEDEDDNALRAALLSSIAAKRAQKEEIVQQQDEEKKQPEPKSPTSTNQSLPLPLIVPSVPPVIKKRKICHADRKKLILERKALALKQLKIARDIEQLKSEIDKLQDKSILNKSEAMPLVRTHFPNIFMKRVVIPGRDLASCSDEEIGVESKKVAQPTHKGNNNFQLSLDSLMKDLRAQSAPVKKARLPINNKAKPPPKPARKFPPKRVPTIIKRPIMKRASLLVGKALSDKDKENLKKSNISHLPKDKQNEYKNLLALLAQKEAAKKKSISAQQRPMVVAAAPEKLAVMDAAVSKDINLAPSIKVSISTSSDEARSVIVGDSGEGGKQPEEPSLETLERDLVKVRKEMCSSLFKLSAEVSQLKEETNKRATAETFLRELKRQVAITEEVIAKKNERINRLKSVVRLSHQDIVSKSQAMSLLKRRCKGVGVSLRGPTYEPPQEGMEVIRKKLTVINNSAKRIPNPGDEEVTVKSDVAQPTALGNDGSSSSSSPSSSSSDSSSDESSDEEVEKGEVMSSSLAHLSRSSVAIDPQVEFCRFDLQGRCNDESCPYQHLRSN